MKTEVRKTYDWGFTLSESELRRIAQTCLEHIRKVLDQETISIKINARLRDGSIIETKILDDLFLLENSGSKQIDKITLDYNDGKERPEYKIFIKLEDAVKNPTSWKAIDFEVIGQSRDWAFLASADIDERLRKIKQVSSPFIVNNRWFVPVVLAITFIIFCFFFLPSVNSLSAVNKLETAYHAGLIKDPIEAMIFLEKARVEAYSGTAFIMPFVISISIPWLFFYGLGKLFTYIAPAYNFYWGDYIRYYDKRRAAQNVFWIVIVLGIAVSIVSAYIMKVLP